MSVSLFLDSAAPDSRNQLRIEPETTPGDSCIWIRGRSETLALGLNATDRATLRAALDAIDAAEAAQAVVA